MKNKKGAPLLYRESPNVLKCPGCAYIYIVYILVTVSLEDSRVCSSSLVVDATYIGARLLFLLMGRYGRDIVPAVVALSSHSNVQVYI